MGVLIAGTLLHVVLEQVFFGGVLGGLVSGDLLFGLEGI